MRGRLAAAEIGQPAQLRSSTPARALPSLDDLLRAFGPLEAPEALDRVGRDAASVPALP